MILLDANVLLYAYDRASTFHKPCREWLEAAMEGTDLVGFPWTSVLAFLRISTNPRAVKVPLAIDTALAIVDEWVQHPRARLVGPEERHWEILRSTLHDAQAAAGLVTDAHLAALAVEHGASVATTDRDFRRFRGLTLVNPAEPD